MSSNRSELIQSAVRFLSDPKVQSSPLDKKIAFLESKGLTSDEVQEAVRLSSQGTSAPSTTASATSLVPAAPGAVPGFTPHPGYVQMMAPPAPVTTWKDYALATCAIVGVGYGLSLLASRYILPFLPTPDHPVFKDSEETQKLVKASNTTLQAIESTSADLLQTLETHAKEITQSMGDLNVYLEALKLQEEKRDEEIKTIREDLDGLKNMIPMMIEKNQQNQAGILEDLQSEVKSLKSLLVTRRVVSTTTTSHSSHPTPSLAAADEPAANGKSEPKIVAGTGVLNGIKAGLPSPAFMSISKPSIPSWQLQSAAATETGAGKLEETQGAPATENADDKQENVEE
ncbi:peroxisomal membrane anchor protein conserved region-domain-containing protein [Polychytrium aggregatum]|uniref:peroxisomal membrane anchor protein conserved region-domain-containing protein n=1 Tax=Polychytrium aggregatum TaxID=110093 RepID=UPI0022FDB793|nr:peroxisomal membrane anchor protein conserved region-domain-containing protein [Polychytrium aggregatum]KAI9207960.1 peroxisomal membrane anchor protein conserved region-domain-containing protein [Polychytrium aggregatum]